MRLQSSLTLPTDVQSVPVARRFVRNALREFGVDAESVASISLALTEACANAVEHSSDRDAEFEVTLELDAAYCVIEVSDHGVGFERALMVNDLTLPDAFAVRGRGLYLMRTLVDELRLGANGDTGTKVRLEKRLHFRPELHASSN